MNQSGILKGNGDVRPRTGAITAGLSLLVMAVIAGLCNFAVINNLIAPADADITAANLLGSSSLVRLAAVGLLVVAILDVVAAWGLYVLLRQINPGVSLLGAWFRVVYAAIFAVVVGGLFSALEAASMDSEQALFLLESFDRNWKAGLILFGIHLLITGLLVWRYGSLSWIFGLLLILPGAGYIVDGVGSLLVPGYTLELAMFTFFGEIVFIFWLLIRGGKVRTAQDTP
jgi:hypothetical protein